MKVTLYCPLCGDSTSADVEMNPAWSAPDDIEDERWSLCPKHATVREFKDAVCPGCVSSWGDCPMFDAFAYSGRRTISGTDYAALEHGRCPRRVNGTFAIRDASIEDLDLSEAAPRGGSAFAAAIRDYVTMFPAGRGDVHREAAE